MKFPVAIIAPLAALQRVATANFDLYEGGENVTWDTGYGAWFVFQDEPDCDDARGVPLWLASDDVSGNKIGIRCEGRGCIGTNDPVDINVLEMNFHQYNPTLHFTIYKDRNYQMYGLDGKVYGQCILFPGDDFQCGGFSSRGGNRKFRCLTNFNAGEINNAFYN